MCEYDNQAIYAFRLKSLFTWFSLRSCLSYSCSDQKSASILSDLISNGKTTRSTSKKQCKRKKGRKKKRACFKKSKIVSERFWTDDEKKPCSYCRGSSSSVEMTAYMAATLVMQERVIEALPSIKWLGKQRNSQGGFVSTQDTVVALQAISMYSQEVARVPMKMTVKVIQRQQGTRQSKLLKKFSLVEYNKLLLQVGH